MYQYGTQRAELDQIPSTRRGRKTRKEKGEYETGNIERDNKKDTEREEEDEVEAKREREREREKGEKEKKKKKERFLLVCGWALWQLWLALGGCRLGLVQLRGIYTGDGLPLADALSPSVAQARSDNT